MPLQLLRDDAIIQKMLHMGNIKAESIKMPKFQNSLKLCLTITLVKIELFSICRSQKPYRMNVQNVTRNLPCRMSHQIEVWYSAQEFRRGIS